MKLFKKSRKRIKKVVKKGKKLFPDVFEDLFKDAEEIWEEAVDFFEDLSENITHKQKMGIKKLKRVNLYGVFFSVRPAYAFAERVENFLKLVFGFSMIISALIASFWGFTRLSDLLSVLINSLLGRIFIIIIGLSYLLLGFWKLLHIRD